MTLVGSQYAKGPEIIIESGGTGNLLSATAEVWLYRSTILAFAQRDIKVKYKQAALGVAWALIQPLAYAAIFTLTLGRLAGVSGSGVPYSAFVLSTFLAWVFLQNATVAGTNALINDAAVVRKVYFPRSVPVLGSVLGLTVDLAIGLGVFAVVGPLVGAKPSATWILVPLLVALTVGLAAAVALALAGLNIYYRDLRHALPFAMQAWLFASPVLYPVDRIPRPWVTAYAVVNPAVGLFDAWRRVLSLGQLPNGPLLLLVAAQILVLLIGGFWLFRKLEPNFADVI